MDKSVNKNNVLLHFGAVDWQCDVYVNNQLVGRHEGGFDPFTMDVTPYLKKGAKQEIALRVWDPTDDGPQPRGKQVNRPNGIWYTPGYRDMANGMVRKCTKVLHCENKTDANIR